jgi:hypothetical protein
MTDERSLTEFSSTEPSVSDTDGEIGESDDRADTSNQPTETEPATITYRWQPNGAVCSRCGTSTQKQWRNDGQFVCPDCKTWDSA